MRKLKVGINGFGRIGRAIFRINQQNKLFDVVAINDINPDNHNIAYLLQYDTTYGKLTDTVYDNKKVLKVGGNTIKVYHEKQIDKVPWSKDKVDILIESSGVKDNLLRLDNLSGSIKNAICTYDIKELGQTIIFGANENKINPKKNFILSTSICDSVALVPIIRLIESTHKIISGYITTLHPWLSYQNLLDGPSVSWSQPGDIFSHYALGRSSPMNIIPKSTSAVIASERVIPGLTKRLSSFSYRVPTSVVSGAVLTVLLNKRISHNSLKNRFNNFEKKQKHKVIKNSVEPLTSVDYIGEEYSAIIDHRWSKINNNRHIKLVYWYDNEFGYSSRVVDLIKELAYRY